MSTQRVLIIDCVSPHEIERRLSTEGDVLSSILANRIGDRGPTVLRFAAAKSFRKFSAKARPDVRYLHVIAHANDKVLGFVEGGVGWDEVADKLKLLVGKLDNGQRRVLCLSCCWSSSAVEKLAPLLSGYFTGIYYLNCEEVDFDVSITVWSMFYLRKPLDEPQKRKDIRDAINGFIDAEEPLLAFKPVSLPPRTHKERQ